MTATSGPGISLMAEFAGLGYFAEIPGVIWDIQRVGPSTGLPTRTAQGDVLSVALLSHGDTQHIALIPGSVEECFEFAIDALDLAEAVPDAHLRPLGSRPRHEQLDVRSVPLSGPTDPPRQGADEGASSRSSAGSGGATTTSTATGFRGARFRGPNIRWRRTSRAARGTTRRRATPSALKTTRRRSTASGRSTRPRATRCRRRSSTGATGRGSRSSPTARRISRSRSRATSSGASGGSRRATCGCARCRCTRRARAFVAAHERVYVVEQNRDGQMADLIRLEVGEEQGRIRKILHYDGLPCHARYVTDAVIEMEGDR